MSGIRETWLPTLLLFALPAIAEEESPWSVDLDVTAGYDDNVGRGLFKRDIFGEYFAVLTGGVNFDVELNARKAMTFRLLAEAESREVVKPLRRTAVGGEFIFRWQGEFGFFEPFYQFSLRGQQEEFEADQRDADVTTIQLQRTRRINGNWTYLLGIEHKATDSDGTVFDLSGSRLFGNLDYRVDSDWVAYGTLSYGKGENYSVAQNRFCNGLPASDIYPLVAVSDAIESDQAFNETFCGSWLAYRTDTHTFSLSLGLNRAFADTYSFDLSVLQIRSIVAEDRDLYYDRQIIRASVLMRF